MFTRMSIKTKTAETNGTRPPLTDHDVSGTNYSFWETTLYTTFITEMVKRR